MLCFVIQPNSIVLEVEVHAKAKGQECLDKVCEMLGILETDYFGLRYTGPTGESYWINRRNEIRHQITGPPPYRLQMRVKFYVPPHLLLHDSTRYLFYITVKQDYIEGKLQTNDRQAVKMTALVAQSEIGDVNTANLPTLLVSYEKWHPKKFMNPKEIAQEHRRLQGMSLSSAQYRFLQTASEVPDFGVEYFNVINKEGFVSKFGVGPRGVVINTVYGKARRVIPFPCILMASQSRRCFFLTYIDDKNKMSTSIYKSNSCLASSTIYRLVTETHSFYSCETVRHAVLSQHVRDLKGTIASIFNERTTLGKNYVFDVTRTFRQVYDDTRRLLHKAVVKDTGLIKEFNDDKDMCHSSECKELQYRLQSLQDSLLCIVCMDSGINSVFNPCRHAVCCQLCANSCTICPICRKNVDSFSHIYLPLI